MTLTRCACAVVTTLLCAGPVRAQSPDQQQPSTYDKIWGQLTNWYDNKDNPVVQRVVFSGRFQHDLAMVEADQGDWRESNVRRVRFGPRITMFRDYLVHAEVEVNPQERNPFYMRLTDAYVMWQRYPKVNVQIGKQAVQFTQEGATSSRELITIDRSNLANNIWFGQEYMPGVSVAGRAAPWSYRAGVYSSGAMNREFGRFNGDWFTMLVGGYDFGKRLGVREATLTGNYVYQQPDVNNTFTRRFEHVASIHFRLEQPKWGFRGDVSKTAGYLGQRDVMGIMAMPFYNITGKLQAVARYTYLDSDGPNGLALNTYENRVTRGQGDEYRETYLGLNYYFYAHRLKVQSGVQFADLRDAANDGGAYSGWSWVSGLRMGW